MANKEEKFEKKQEKALEKKKELTAKIDEIKGMIAKETDEKKKKKLRRQRDELSLQLEGIAKSKDGATIPLSLSAKRIIKSVVAVVVIVALLAVYVATGTVRHGLVSYFGVPQSTFTAFTISDGDGNKHSVKVDTYNYYFALTYNNLQSMKQQYQQYGMDLDQYNLNIDFDKKLSDQTIKNEDDKTVTCDVYVHDRVVDSIKTNYLYYYEALKNNDNKEPEITEEQQKELDETLKQYEEQAKTYGFTLSGFLTASMGKGVDEDVFRREAKIAYIAENYQNDLNDKLSNKEYSDADYNKYRDEHKDDLMGVDVRIFDCQSEDEAKKFAKDLKADASNFAALASKYSESKWDKAANKADVETTYKGITRSQLTSAGYAVAQADEHKHEEGEEHHEDEEQKYSGLDWIFSSKRKAGDVKQQSTTVVYILKPAYLPEQKTVSVRHILISPVADDEKDSSKQATDATKKEWAAAKKKAEKILKQYKDGKHTAEAFGKLAKDNSKDGNAAQGGLYENVTPNQMVPTFNAWCFDSSRKAGDVAIVQTKFGYHIMYFEATNKLTAWQYTAQQALASDDSKDSTDKLEKSYSIKTNWFGSRYFEKDTDIDS